MECDAATQVKATSRVGGGRYVLVSSEGSFPALNEEQDGVARRNGCGVAGVDGAEILACPEVSGESRVKERETGEVEGDGGRCGRAVEKEYGTPAGRGESLGPSFETGTGFGRLDGLEAERVLVDGEHRGVGEDGCGGRTELCKIGTNKERRTGDGPEAHVDPVLGVAEAGHAHDHHVGIVVEAGMFSLGMNALVEISKHFLEAGFSFGVFAAVSGVKLMFRSTTTKTPDCR